jgi:quercetin dioxygenase-like cupin family protein
MEIVQQFRLPFVGMSHEFIGADHSRVDISFFLVTTAEPGRGARLHKHDYDEIVYVISGRSKWTVNGVEHEAAAGDVLIVKAGEPHKFMNVGDETLRQIDIHLHPTFETTWLE